MKPQNGTGGTLVGWVAPGAVFFSPSWGKICGEAVVAVALGCPRSSCPLHKSPSSTFICVIPASGRVRSKPPNRHRPSPAIPGTKSNNTAISETGGKLPFPVTPEGKKLPSPSPTPSGTQTTLTFRADGWTDEGRRGETRKSRFRRTAFYASIQDERRRRRTERATTTTTTTIDPGWLAGFVRRPRE